MRGRLSTSWLEPLREWWERRSGERSAGAIGRAAILGGWVEDDDEAALW